MKHSAKSDLPREDDKANDIRLATACSVIEECFWGDYLLTPEELLSRLDSGEPGFDRFIFSKIIENASKPSWYLPVLFPPDRLQTLLDRYLRMAGKKKRVRIVAANLTGRYDLVPELQWHK